MLLADGTSDELVEEFRLLTERNLVIIRTLSMRLKQAEAAKPHEGAGNMLTGRTAQKTSRTEV